jgi:hypothetical protein
MRPRLRLVLTAMIATLAVGCGGASPAASEPPVPAGMQFRLRVTTIQALPPSATFGQIPSALVTVDGHVLSGGAVPAIFPGPLVNPVIDRDLSSAGWMRRVQAARAAGLLGSNADFTGGQLPPGAAVTRLELVADGRLYDLRGDATRQIVCVQAPCVAPPGTPEAFAGFVGALLDLESVVGRENLGPALPYQPSGYAIIVNPNPPDQQGLPQPARGWPLTTPLAELGKPLADGSGGRCGLVTAAGDAARLTPAFTAANQLTGWRDADGSMRGLVVRPLLPGDTDPCAGLV